MTGFEFDGNMNNGGVDVKLGIYHVQGARIVKKNFRNFRRNGGGRIKYDGEIIRKKGNAYMVDCTVT